MTADEARRLTLSNYPEEKLEDYHNAIRIIEKAANKPTLGTSFQIMISGNEFKAASILALLIDGYKVWYDSSELATHIEWWPEYTYTKAP